MRHSSGDEMSIVAIEETARRWASELEVRESKRSGVPIRVARNAVARRMQVPPGTLENLKNRRLKGIRVLVFERIRAAFVREVELDIASLQHELEMARLCRIDADQGQISEMEAHLSALREVRNAGL